MKRLSLARPPRPLRIDDDLEVQVRPLRQAELMRLLADHPSVLERDAAAGLTPREAVAAAGDVLRLAVDLATMAVADWTVVDDRTGERLPVTEAVAEALFGEDLALAGAFVERVLALVAPEAAALADEGNVSAPSPSGPSAGATPTAPRAPDAATTARSA